MGQPALQALAKKTESFGYDGLELACWGDHFETQRVLAAALLSAKEHASVKLEDVQ